MKDKKYWVLAAMLVICASVLWAANKTDSPQVTFYDEVLAGLKGVTLCKNQRDVLAGLQGVRVLVEHLNPKVEEYGLEAQQLQNDVELRLRQNGIKVLSEQEYLSTLNPCLYVCVIVDIRPESSLVVSGITLELREAVLLIRDQTKLCMGGTWWTASTGSVGLNNIKTIREGVKDNVDKFINDYLAVNPKK
jgi:hypothetical protein